MRKDFSRANRRRFLHEFGISFAVLGVLPGEARSAETIPLEKSNLDLVNAFCASFATRDMSKIASYLSDTCVYRVTETAAPLVGPAAVERIKGYVDRSSSVEFAVLESWVKGPIVTNERIDTFVSPQRTMKIHLTGVFFVKDGKIAEWTDYVIR